ncbi:ornithine carbamoyltransferase [Methanofollis sp. W23]|uniref:ornithine carbamoyltransferase n=1 Tax=Methanofollis sp. W23 TaxID=2817849 RepID=UPI001AE398AF|nr:ornithine carbamoyltransferase [Methanofollis sp. W23]MBP2145024.1 ornithine carbamoyltransferase [Methanofollis sp. W23]
MKKDFLTLLDSDAVEVEALLDGAARLKKYRAEGKSHAILPGCSLGMIFEKASTRTRVSFEAGMHDLGGHALFLNPADMQLGRGELVRDTARVLSRFVSAVMIRAYKHSTIEEFAKYSSVPVINGLSDKAHPCQVLADLLTLKERFSSLEGLRVAWIGDGNNVCNSLLVASAYTGLEVQVATPPGYRPPSWAVEAAEERGARFTFFDTPEEAAEGAHALYTDVWVSMGNEEEREKRLRDFKGYTLTADLVRRAEPDAIVMHCLPAHRGEEITEEVLEGPQSVVWDQAENRLHAQKALLVNLLSDKVHSCGMQ